MFTGIVQGMGKLVAIKQPAPDFRTHTVALPDEMSGDIAAGCIGCPQWLLLNDYAHSRQRSGF